MNNLTMPLLYITRNLMKYRMASLAFEGSRFILERLEMDVPEIQSEQVEEVASTSAAWAYRKLGRPVVVTDAGFSVTALRGFPGPFIHYVNQWFTVEDYLRLMHGLDDRSVVIQDCLAFARPPADVPDASKGIERPGQFDRAPEPVVFCSRYPGTLALVPSDPSAGLEATPMDRLFIPTGYDRTISQIDPAGLAAHWGRDGVWRKLRAYLDHNRPARLTRRNHGS
jgi:XTP/dITP diphosphohydrolase